MTKQLKKHKFEIGQRVRRSRRWWKEEKSIFYGVIVERGWGSDNNGRSSPSYFVQWTGKTVEEALQKSNAFLEQELEVA